MKRFGRLATYFALSFVAPFMLTATTEAAQGTAKVQAIRSGSAVYTVDRVTWQPLSVGTVLNQGATIKTDAIGVVDLYLAKNGPLVRLTPDTTLALSTLTLDEGVGETVVNTQLGLDTGRIQGVVRKLSQSSRYEIKTPVGTCGIRGTVYEVTAALRVTIQAGTTEVRYTAPGQTAPSTFDVKAGYTFDPTLNNGMGGVIPTPAGIADQLREDIRDLLGGAPEEVVRMWKPSPIWDMPERPFDPPGGGPGMGPPFDLPPVSNPTSPVTVPHPARGFGS